MTAIQRWVKHSPTELALWRIDGGRAELVAVSIIGPRLSNSSISFRLETYRRQALRPGHRRHWDHPDPPGHPAPHPPMSEAWAGPDPDQAPVVIPPRGTDEGADEFYARIAEAYMVFADQGHAPLRRIADAMGVPKTRVVNWVTQARRRGYLPPTQKGVVSV